MSETLRILVEVNGQTVVDIGKEVRSVSMSLVNGHREKPYSPVVTAFVEREPDGTHGITIDYEDVPT